MCEIIVGLKTLNFLMSLFLLIISLHFVKICRKNKLKYDGVIYDIYILSKFFETLKMNNSISSLFKNVWRVNKINFIFKNLNY